MSISTKYLAIMEEGHYYHVYNRTNNRELLFRADENYAYFLKLYTKHLRPFCKTYSWCLLPNHFHFLLQVRPVDTIYDHLRALSDNSRLIQKVQGGDMPAAHRILSNAFQKLFTAYAMGYNSAYNRKGNLFHRPFKRLLIEDDRQIINTAIYIHTNPKHHGLTADFEAYPRSSYNVILERAYVPEPAYLLTQFGGKDAYVEAHKNRAEHIVGDIED